MVTVGLVLADLANARNKKSPLYGLKGKAIRQKFWNPISQAYADMIPRGGTVTVLMDAATGHEPPEAAGTIWTKIEKPSLTGQTGKGAVKEIYRVDPKDKKNPNKKYPYWPHESTDPSTSTETEGKHGKHDKPGVGKPSTEKPNEPSTSKPVEPSTSKPDEPSTTKPVEPSEPSAGKPSTTKHGRKPGKKSGETTVLRRLAAARKVSQGFEIPRRH
ncbi:hypothetical protein MMC13_007810 [Lambiella insularis]|nr:hypothetical protein [Lambiella insularis]